MWTRSSAGVNPYYLYITSNQGDARIEDGFPRIFGMTVRCKISLTPPSAQAAVLSEPFPSIVVQSAPLALDVINAFVAG
jgi:hypothetical protein